jgi:hypothetical protein
LYYWPTESRPVPLEELGWVNTSYLASTSSQGDSSIVWGTTVQTDELARFIAEQRRQTVTMISMAHVLIRAVVEAMHQHPTMNRRVVGRRVYPYNGVHITMPILETRSGEVNLIYLRHAERLSLVEISRTIWEEARNAAVRAATETKRKNGDSAKEDRWHGWSKWLRLQWVLRMSRFGFSITNRFRLPTTTIEEINGSSAFVNHLGFAGAPPMISYKPSCLPTNSFSVNVTLGPTEMRPVADGDMVVLRSVAPLFVRTDHRLVNGYRTAEFVSTLRNALQNPEGLVLAASATK